MKVATIQFKKDDPDEVRLEKLRRLADQIASIDQSTRIARLEQQVAALQAVVDALP